MVVQIILPSIKVFILEIFCFGSYFYYLHPSVDCSFSRGLLFYWFILSRFYLQLALADLGGVLLKAISFWWP